MHLTENTLLKELPISNLLMFVEQAFCLPVYVSGEIEPEALNWSIKTLSDKSGFSLEESIEKLRNLFLEHNDLEIDPSEVTTSDFYLLVSRNGWEICHLEQSKFIADIDFPKEFEEMKTKNCVVICHHGIRSLSVQCI